MVKELTEQVKSQGYQQKKTACPKCEIGHLIRGKSSWGCSNWKKGCKFTLPYEYKGITINDSEMLELIHNGITRYSYIFNKKKADDLKKIVFSDKLKLEIKKEAK